MAKSHICVPATAKLCAILLLVACGGEKDNDVTDSAIEVDAGDAGGQDEDAGGARQDAGASRDAAPQDATAALDPCPAELKCTAPQGRFLCTKPSGEVLTCEKAADCSFGMCYKLAGQGIC